MLYQGCAIFTLAMFSARMACTIINPDEGLLVGFEGLEDALHALIVFLLGLFSPRSLAAGRQCSRRRGGCMGPCMLVINEVSTFQICSVSQNPIRSLRRSHDCASLSSSPTQEASQGQERGPRAHGDTLPEDRELQRKVLRCVLSHAMLYAMAQSRGLSRGRRRFRPGA